KKVYLVLPIHDGFIAYPGLEELITDVMKKSYHARMKVEVGVKPDLTFLEREIGDEGLPTTEEYPDVLDIVENRLSNSEYAGYRNRLVQFFDGQTAEWFQRFRVSR